MIFRSTGEPDAGGDNWGQGVAGLQVDAGDETSEGDVFTGEMTRRRDLQSADVGPAERDDHPLNGQNAGPVAATAPDNNGNAEPGGLGHDHCLCRNTRTTGVILSLWPDKMPWSSNLMTVWLIRAWSVQFLPARARPSPRRWHQTHMLERHRSSGNTFPKVGELVDFH